MTREEAIKILKAIRVYDCYPKSASEETKEAIDMAIEALQCADKSPRTVKLTEDIVVTLDEEAYEIGYTHGQMADRPKGEWIPVSERLPDELAAVNITWVNHNPPPYYKYIKDVTLVDSAVYYRGKWYWWDATVIDLLGEYDGAYIHGIEPVDKDIEILAWMPLPKPYREDGE